MVASSEIDQGEKECIRITTRRGRFLDCTPDHRILTDVGWVEAKDLTKDHALAMLRKTPEPEGCEYIKESRFMGMMLGDGCMLGTLPPHFTNTNQDILDTFVTEVEYLFDMTPKARKLRDGLTHTEFYITNGKNGSRVRGSNQTQMWLKRADMWGKRAWEKYIPQWFLEKADNKSLAEMIAGLMDTDGSVAVQSRNTRTQIKYGTTSERLAWDMIFMLSRLGIHPKLCMETPERNVKAKHTMYTVLIDDGPQAEIFKKYITLTPKKQKRLDDAVLSKKGSNYIDHLGCWVWKALAAAGMEQGINNRMFMMARCQDRRISLTKLIEVLDLLPEKPADLVDLTNPEIFWDQLKTSEPVGMRAVFDRSVLPESPNFVANGFIVHNSIENSVSLFLSVRDHETYPTIKVVHVIKNTRGTAGFTCQMAWDGPCTKFSPPGEELIPDEPDEEDEEMGPDNPVF